MHRIFGKLGRFLLRHWIITGSALLLLVFSMASHWLERLFVYYPVRQIDEDPGALGLRYQELAIVADDGIRLHGWFVPCEGARRTVLILHGNGGNISHRLPFVERLHALDTNVLLIDYRGYGKSEGQPFEDGLYRDAQAGYRWWERERKSRGEQLILLGESLGGAVAVHLAARMPVDGLILQSTFTSAKDMARTMFPLGLLLPLTGIRFDSRQDIRRVVCPKLIIHGTQDEIVPFGQGKALFDAAPGSKMFYAVRGAGHNDLLWVAGAEYSRQLQSFLAGSMAVPAAGLSP